MPQSDDTLLRSLKHHTVARAGTTPVRVAGIDDWSWQKGSRYGTIMVDLERREVVDVLPDRSSEETAAWLGRHPEVEVISRDRCGVYAQGALQGAPQARQVADRFHLLENLRRTIEQQTSRAPLQQRPFDPTEVEQGPLAPPAAVIHRYGQPDVMEHRRLARSGRRAARRASFDKVKALQVAGESLAAITRETGLNWRTVAKWTRLAVLPERRTMAPKATTPSGFRSYLARRWKEGCTIGRQLLAEIRPLG
jgi:transposase